MLIQDYVNRAVLFDGSWWLVVALRDGWAVLEIGTAKKIIPIHWMLQLEVKR